MYYVIEVDPRHMLGIEARTLRVGNAVQGSNQCQIAFESEEEYRRVCAQLSGRDVVFSDRGAVGRFRPFSPPAS
ncbi:MAG: hypothetical protein JWR80_6404 [Bradyrhizobium sp.]|nr:hypothetical protein [Bradyrhizobium sp.]